MMPSVLIAAARLSTAEFIFIVVAGILALPLFYAVHRGLNYCYLTHARRFCRQHGFAISRWRCGPEFNQSGVKTEFTVVELDCFDGQKQRRLVRLLVWLFGIRRVLSDDKFPESHDEQSLQPRG
jgi:hypothetical protein